MSKRAFKYRGGDRTVEEVTRNTREAGGDYDNYLDAACSFYKAKEGGNAIRILPRTWDDIKVWGKGWYIKVFLHRNVGPDNGTYLCLKMKGEHCPICEAKHQAANEDEADAIKAQARILCWIIDRDNERAGPQVMSMPITLFREISSRTIDKSTETVIYIDDPEKGYDVSFTREGTTKKTKYVQVEIDRKSSFLSKSEEKEDTWLDFIENHPLPDMLVYYEAAHIEKVLFGQGGTPASSSEEVDRGGSRRSRRSEPDESEDRSRRSRSATDDEDGDTEQATGQRSSRRDAADDDEVSDDRVSRRARHRSTESDENDETEPDEGSVRGGGRSRYRSTAEEPDEEPEERPTTRRRGSSEPRNGDDDEEDNSPTGQVRSRMSRMRRG